MVSGFLHVVSLFEGIDMKLLYGILMILIMLLGASFAVLNAEPVSIDYYFGQDALPLSLLMVMTLGIGGIMGICVSLIPFF